MNFMNKLRQVECGEAGVAFLRCTDCDLDKETHRECSTCQGFGYQEHVKCMACGSTTATKTIYFTPGYDDRLISVNKRVLQNVEVEGIDDFVCHNPEIWSWIGVTQDLYREVYYQESRWYSHSKGANAKSFCSACEGSGVSKDSEKCTACHGSGLNKELVHQIVIQNLVEDVES